MYSQTIAILICSSKTAYGTDSYLVFVVDVDVDVECTQYMLFF